MARGAAHGHMPVLVPCIPGCHNRHAQTGAACLPFQPPCMPVPPRLNCCHLARPRCRCNVDLSALSFYLQRNHICPVSRRAGAACCAMHAGQRVQAAPCCPSRVAAPPCAACARAALTRTLPGCLGRPAQDHLKAESYMVKGVPSRFCQRCGQVSLPAAAHTRGRGGPLAPVQPVGASLVQPPRFLPCPSVPANLPPAAPLPPCRATRCLSLMAASAAAGRPWSATTSGGETSRRPAPPPRWLQTAASRRRL